MGEPILVIDKIHLILWRCFGINRAFLRAARMFLSYLPRESGENHKRKLKNQNFFRGLIMSRVCQVTGKKPMTGNNVSHAQNKTRRRFEPNLHTHRFWVEGEKRFVKLRVSSKGLRIIDKQGIEKVLADLRGRGAKV